ncbi:MAG TPA: FecR family protein [Methylomirabilota bacterium]|nr:FecR family protein [Methylomirabilota bacterium]
MRTIPRSAAASALALLLTLGVLAPARAQESSAGHVTRLEGTAAVARTATPQPLPLKPPDKVYLRDLVTTAEQSRAQLLLGGKALVTIREQSSLRINEVPGGSTIDVTDGKLKVYVGKDHLKPGERIEVRTPTAITAVRGTAWITEVIKRPSAPPLSRITVLDGIVEVTPLDPVTGRPSGQVVRLSPLQQLEVDGTTPGTPVVISRADADRLDATFAFALKAGPGTNADLLKRQVDQAASDAAKRDLLPPGTGGTTPSLSGDDLRSRSGIAPLPPTPPSNPGCGRSC